MRRARGKLHRDVKRYFVTDRHRTKGHRKFYLSRGH
jgi:hypothetical protein